MTTFTDLFSKLPNAERDFLICEQNKGKDLKVIDGKIVAVEHVPTEQEKISSRILELKSLLNKTDCQAIKFAEGELTAEEYLPIKQKRRSYRAEINSLEEKLKNFA